MQTFIQGTLTFSVRVVATGFVMLWVIAFLALRLTAGKATVQSGQCVAPPTGLVSWWPGDGNANDIQGSNHGTPQNGATFGAGEVGQAFNFNGNASVNVPDNVSLNQQRFTIEAWIKTGGTTNAAMAAFIVAKSGTDGLSGYELNIGTPSQNGTLRFVLNGGAGGADFYGVTSVTNNAFHHVAATYDGATMKIYVDGHLDAQRAVTLTINYPSGRPFMIGKREHTSPPGPFPGLIDEVSFYNRALTTSEIQAAFNASSTGKCKPQCASLPPQMVSWWSGDGHANDIQSANNGVLQNGATFASGKVGQAFSFDGADDYIDIGQLSQLQDVREITVMAWVKKSSTTPSDSVAALVGKWNTTDQQTDNSFLLYNGEQESAQRGRFILSVDEDGISQASDYVGVAGNTAIPNDQWVLVTATWRSSDGQMVIYKNGVPDGMATGGVGKKMKVHTSYTAKIGEWGVVRDSRYKFKGLIDEVQIVTRALSAAEIQAIYQADSAGVCQPTCVSLPQQMVSWWPGDGNANDIQGSNHGTLQNGATFTTGKVGQAFSFDGVDDFVSVPGTFGGTSEVTIETWVKNEGGSSDFQAIVSAPDSNFVHLQINTSGNNVVHVDDGAIVSLPIIEPSSVRNFSHVALSAKSGATRLYVNGQLVGESNQTFNIIRPTSGLRIGSGFQQGRFFKGVIDEVSIYNRALSAAEIQAIYNAGSAGKCPACVPLPQQTVAWYRGEGNANDIAGSNNGTLQNGATFATGKVGQGFLLDGVDDFVQMPHSAALQPTTALTVEAWVKFNGFYTGACLGNYVVSKGFSNGNPAEATAGAYRLVVVDTNTSCGPATGNKRASFGIGFSGNEALGVLGNTPIQTGVFYHLAGTYDGSEIRLYVNGVLDGTSVVNKPLGFNSDPLTIGRFFHSGFPYFVNGIIDEVGIYSRALTGQEVAAIFAAGGAGKCAPTQNTPPTITAASAPELKQGSVATGVRLAIVSDDRTPASNVTVATSSVPAGLTITNLTNANGAITANVAVTCAATTGAKTVTLTATDADNATSTTNLTINLGANTSPNAGVYLSTEIFPVGGGKTVTPTTAPSDNGLISSISATATGFTGSFSGNPANGALTINNAAPVGLFTVTVTVTDNCGATATTTFPLNVAFAPDLQVNAIPNPPQEIYNDTAFNLTWVDKNEGNARANPPWTDKVWFSADNQVSANDTLLGSFALTQTLDPAQSLSRTQSLSVPRVAIPANGQFFLIVQTDADNGVNEQAREDNNTRAVAVTANRRPLPDLIVQSIEAPTTAFFDQTITVRWTVKNMGGGSTDAAEWTDWAYLSSDNVPEIEDPFKLPMRNVSYLAAGESYVASADVRIPRGLVGNYNVIVYTDHNGSNGRGARFVVEEENENNNVTVRPIQLSAPPLPDLRVAFVNGPEQAFTGQAMLIDWRVENRAAATRPDQTTWLDSFYLSKDTTLSTTADRLIGSRFRTEGLAQNAGYTVNSYSVTIPNDIAGKWYLFVVTDAQDAIFEFGNENNNSNYDQQRIRIVATPPDLLVTAFTTPATATAARSVNVSWTIRNQGAFDAAPFWFDTIYLSNTATLNPATATPLASVPRSSVLKPGLTYTASADVTIPACLSGAFHLFVAADSRNQVFEFDPNYDAEANNFSAARPLQITAIPPDLRVTAVTGPATVSAGQPFAVSWTVANQGGGPTLETAWVDRLYLSPTATLDLNTALLVADYTRTGALAQNASYSRTESPTVPTRAQGPYYLFVVTDASDVVEECANDGNNARATAATLNVGNNLPDLTIASINPLAATLAGQTITVAWTGRNTGTATAQNSAWNDAVYLSTDQTLDSSDRLLANKLSNGPLAINATYNAQAQVTIPVVTAGSYFVIVVADAGNFVFEGQRENNNTSVQPIQITTPNVDLRVTAVDAPAQAFSGTAVTINWTVNNAGAATTLAAQWTDQVIFSRDQILDATDPVFGYLVHNGALNGGASYNATLNVEIPAGLSGPYYVFVRTDANNALAETNEGNNFGYDMAALTLQIPPPADLLLTTINSPGTGTPGENATLSWVIKNMGSNAAVGQWTDAVYLSANQTWDIGDAEIGRVDHLGSLAAGQSYTGSLTAKLPAVSPGSYYFIVRADVRNRVREVDETNNASASLGRTSVDVPTLTLGVPTSSTLQTGQERFYKVNVPGNETLRLALDGQSPQHFNELFARFGLLPSRSAYDFLYNRPYAPDQEIVVPDTKTGTYYSLARGAYAPNGADPFSIKAEVVPFGITSVSPNRIGDNGQVTITVRGAKFQGGSIVKLTRAAITLTAIKVSVVDSATLKATFFLSNALRTTYSVAVTTPGGNTTILESSLVIERATPLQSDLYFTGSPQGRIGRAIPITGTFKNSGNIDLPYVIVSTEVSADVSIANDRPTNSLPLKSQSPNVDWENASPTNTRSGTSTSDFFVVRDVPPGEQIDFTFRVLGLRQQADLKVFLVKKTYNEHYNDMRNMIDEVRQTIVKEGVHIPNQAMQAALTSPSAWWNLISAQLIAPGYIDNSSTSSQLMQRATDQETADFVRSANTTNLSEESCTALCTGEFALCQALIIRSLIKELGLCAFLAEFPPLYAACGAAAAAKALYATYHCTKQLTCCLDGCKRISPPPGCFFIVYPLGDCVLSLICPLNPADPNEKSGDTGYGIQRLVGNSQTLPYKVDFENIPAATATAQRIRITDQLDTNLDWRTFRLKEIGFGSYRIPIPDNQAFFQGRVQLGPELGNLLADLSAGIDIATGQVFWTLTALDPTTGEQPNSAALGLLPPNDSTGRGQGYVSYTVQPRADKPTGTVISNKATITFDTEEPIVTNTVTNTLDADAPVSAITALPASSSASFTLSWSGSDAANGSGLQSFDIWVAENDGPYQPFLTGTTATSAQLTSTAGKLYRFYSTARDNAGNVEAAPAAPDAVTLVGTVTNAAPTLAALAPGGAVAGGAAFTLTVNGSGFVPGSVVRWNGTARQTTFVSPAQLNAAISAGDIAGTGTAKVTVFTPAPGGGTSSALGFTVVAQPFPLPTIANLSPGFAATGSAGFTLTVNGTNFTNGSKVRWNGGDLATTFVSNTQLRAAITAAQLATAGTASVTIFNPTPGGGTSNVVAFSIAPLTVHVSAANYTSTTLASEAIIAAFGNGLATTTRAATTMPLPTELAGTTVRVRDSSGAERFAPLFFVSPTQVNYQMPPGTAVGAATVTIASSTGSVTLGSVQLAAVAPGLFTADASGRGLPAAIVLRVKADGSQTTEAVALFNPVTNKFVAVPIDFGSATDQVFLILFGTGIRNRSSLTAVTATVGGVNAVATFAGAQGSLIGVDQVNLQLPRSLSGRGEVDVSLTVDSRIGNAVKIQIK